MRAPLSWLRDFAPFGDDPRILAETLDDLGLVVEQIERVGEGLDDVVVAEVKEIASIPGADKIRRVVVDAGDGPVEVVCGADNFSIGDLVPLAPAGSVLPGGLQINRRTMKGVVSDGMLCSGRELRLSDDQSGLLVLTGVEGARPGLPLGQALGISPDVVFDITVEGNRPDAWSMAGVARDLAARLDLPFALPDPSVPTPSGPPVATQASLVLDDPALCPRITARVLSGVVIGPSPRWLARRLTMAGMRPVNNVVDASNYVMLELGQPTHPYDLDRLAGGLLVRRARPGETIETLDGVVRTLGRPGLARGDTGEDCVICDAAGRPVGIGGVMGGGSSEISPGTSRVLLEAAYFAPMAIARTSKRLGLRTEASARFERGADPWAIDRAADRIVELVGASQPALVLAAGVLEAHGELPPTLRLDVPLARVNAVLGTTFDAETVARLIEPIGFACDPSEGGATLAVTIPSFRPDVRPAPHGIDDVVEEVARTFGYARLPRRQPTWPDPGRLNQYQRERRRTRDVLCGVGASETWTPTFVSADDHGRMDLPGTEVEVANPLVQAERFLRRSLLPGLLGAVAYNADRRQGDVRLFEVGTVFSHPDQGGRVVERSGAGGGTAAALPGEREMLGAAFAHPGDDARTAIASWHVLREALRLRDVRMIAPSFGAGGNGDGNGLEVGWLDGPGGVSPDRTGLHGLHPTRSAVLVAVRSAMVIGAIGEVDPVVVGRFGLGSRRIGWLELDLGRLLDPEVVPRWSDQARPVSRFPSSDVDLALVVEDHIPADRVADALAGAGGPVLESVTLFDVFRGGSVGPGRRSLAFRLRFCADDHTLTEAEVAALRRACIDAAATQLGATLR